MWLFYFELRLIDLINFWRAEGLSIIVVVYIIIK